MFNMSAMELSAAIKAKKYDVAEVVGAFMDKIEKNDGQYNAFLSAFKEKAMSSAREIQSRISGGEQLSPLAGTPIALSDNISVEGMETTCASKMLSGYVPVYSATVVERLERAGMVVIGKLNMDEFGMRSVSGGAFGPVRNPWDLSRKAGGASGGSAAAVAAGEIPLSLGSDAGGDLRQPCAYCGVTGLKPSYGAVSRYGLISGASSLEGIGPVGKNIDDCAALLSIISGADGRDGNCVMEEPFRFSENDSGCLDGVKIGLLQNLLGINSDLKAALLAAAKEFEALGAIVEEFEMPLADFIFPAWYTIACAEASSNLARYDGIKYGYRSAAAKTLSEVYRMSRGEGFASEAKRRVMFGSLMLSSGYYDSHYRKAMQARTLVKEAYRKLFTRFDMLLSPVTPGAAGIIDVNPGSPEEMQGEYVYNAAANLAGFPSAALPCGFDGQGLPLGFQLSAGAFMEEKLINAARAYQSRSSWHEKAPMPFAPSEAAQGGTIA